MEKEQLRLEILRLCNRHDFTVEMVIARAKELEKYIFDVEVKVVTEAPSSGKASKKSKGNTDILS